MSDPARLEVWVSNATDPDRPSDSSNMLESLGVTLAPEGPDEFVLTVTCRSDGGHVETVEQYRVARIRP